MLDEAARPGLTRKHRLDSAETSDFDAFQLCGSTRNATSADPLADRRARALERELATAHAALAASPPAAPPGEERAWTVGDADDIDAGGDGTGLAIRRHVPFASAAHEAHLRAQRLSRKVEQSVAALEDELELAAELRAYSRSARMAEAALRSPTRGVAVQ
jgi:hypothetical protein